MHRPLYMLQLVRRDEVAAASYAGAVIVAWWKKLRHPLEDLKDLDKMGTAAIDLAPCHSHRTHVYLHIHVLYFNVLYVYTHMYI
jgi:hypothetical protein